MSDDPNYKIHKEIEKGDIHERKNVEICVEAPNKKDVLELYEEALNP